VENADLVLLDLKTWLSTSLEDFLQIGVCQTRLLQTYLASLVM